MKRLMIMMALALTVSASAWAMSYEEAMTEARYLTDKMAYELGLTSREYDRMYRINLDYLLSVDDYDDLYSSSWRARNSAFRAFFNGRQWNLYVGADYFYRPLSWRNGAFVHNIYMRYPRRHAPRYVVPCPPPPCRYGPSPRPYGPDCRDRRPGFGRRPDFDRPGFDRPGHHHHHRPWRD